MQLKYQFDDEESIDVLDPLGSMLFSGGACEPTIIFECTYIDAWLVELLKNLEPLIELGHAKVSIVEEPEHLGMTLSGQLLTIECGALAISGNFFTFVSSLLKVGREFVSTLANFPGWEANPAISEISRNLENIPDMLTKLETKIG